jgi:hypothetical protein
LFEHTFDYVRAVRQQWPVDPTPQRVVPTRIVIGIGSPHA